MGHAGSVGMNIKNGRKPESRSELNKLYAKLSVIETDFDFLMVDLGKEYHMFA